jgi:DNA-binding transcriptional regulator YhcF (GntR family)
MLNLIHINEHSKIPKYKQIINSILTGIENDEIKINNKLPSVNQMLIEFDISRDTIVRAYDDLKARKIIVSVPGKGYYIKDDRFKLKARVFLLFNKLSAHKKLIYDAFAKTIGNHATIDFFIYENNYRHFKELVKSSKSRDYTHYVIIPHFDEGGEDLVAFLTNEIPLQKLVILDKKLNDLNSSTTTIYQDFENDIYTALLELDPFLQKYSQIKLIFGNRTYQPKEIKNGFERFCREYSYDFDTINNMDKEPIMSKTAYVNLRENDLVILLKKIKLSKFVLGEDVGIISYNDTILKEVLADGITVISTDFQNLGVQAAHAILERKKIRLANPFYVIKRKSL